MIFSNVMFLAYLDPPCHVLTLAPLVVPLKLHYLTYTFSTFSSCPYAPKLPTMFAKENFKVISIRICVKDYVTNSMAWSAHDVGDVEIEAATVYGYAVIAGSNGRVLNKDIV